MMCPLALPGAPPPARCCLAAFRSSVSRRRLACRLSPPGRSSRFARRSIGQLLSNLRVNRHPAAYTHALLPALPRLSAAMLFESVPSHVKQLLYAHVDY